MKVVDIAIKDLTRSLRSAFLIAIMFVAPLLLTGLIYLAFSGLIGSGGGLVLPKTTVLVANLDQPPATAGFNGGDLLAQYLAGPEMTQLLQTRPVETESAARQAVDSRQADVAVIIPPEFTAAAAEPQRQAKVSIYYHPDSAISARVAKVMVGDFVDGFVGTKIAVHVASHQLEGQGVQLPDQASDAIAQAYVAWVQTSVGGATGHSGAAPGQGTSQPVLSTRPPMGPGQTSNQATLFLGPVMAGFMVFFMFFTGAAVAQSILYEEHEGTLARLFTTPTPHSMILGGKFLGVVVTLVVQAAVLMLAAALLFGIRWGQAASVVLLTSGGVVAAAGFGVLLMSLIRSTRQAGPLMAVVVTLTGLLGGLMPTGDPSQPPPFEQLTLVLPQGWAQHGWRLALAGAGAADILVPFLVLVVSGAGLFTIGALIFRRRFQ